MFPSLLNLTSLEAATFAAGGRSTMSRNQGAFHRVRALKRPLSIRYNRSPVQWTRARERFVANSIANQTRQWEQQVVTVFKLRKYRSLTICMSILLLGCNAESQQTDGEADRQSERELEQLTVDGVENVFVYHRVSSRVQTGLGSGFRRASKAWGEDDRQRPQTTPPTRRPPVGTAWKRHVPIDYEGMSGRATKKDCRYRREEFRACLHPLQQRSQPRGYGRGNVSDRSRGKIERRSFVLDEIQGSRSREAEVVRICEKLYS